MLDRYFQLGYVVSTHGLKGELKVMLDSDDPQYYQELESIFVMEKQKLIPFFIEWFQIKPDGKALLKLEDVNSLEEASKFKGNKLFLPDELLPELEDGQFYYHELIGFGAFHKSSNIGTIVDFYTEGPQDLFVLSYESREILIPVNDEFIDEIDHTKKLIKFDLPDGLLEIYLQ